MAQYLTNPETRKLEVTFETPVQTRDILELMFRYDVNCAVIDSICLQFLSKDEITELICLLPASTPTTPARNGWEYRLAQAVASKMWGVAVL